jgi:hypothetical protein
MSPATVSYTFQARDFRNLINLVKNAGMDFFYLLHDESLHFSSIDRRYYSLLRILFNLKTDGLERFEEPRGILEVYSMWRNLSRISDGIIRYEVPLMDRSWGGVYHTAGGFRDRPIHKVLYDRPPERPYIPTLAGDRISFKMGLRTFVKTLESMSGVAIMLEGGGDGVYVGDIDITDEVIGRLPLNTVVDDGFSGFVYDRDRILDVLKVADQLTSGIAVMTTTLTEKCIAIFDIPSRLGHITYAIAPRYAEKITPSFKGKTIQLFKPDDDGYERQEKLYDTQSR